ncbi:hypothetical protein VNO78_06685 [Psophocarpus tetragonolobus]|uniref:RING-type E3 ubiquitin transferase n=1 Tax=Psophocarpus tetragonolobus TaxID=3891 RepID=A0AAN9SSD4_PSOTE
MQRSILDDSWIIDSTDLSQRRIGNTIGIIIDFDAVFDSIELGHYNTVNNEVLRVDPSNQDPIRNFQKIKIEEKEVLSSELLCSICLGVFPFGSEAVQMPQPCSHMFHQTCITKWLNINNTCPLCRRTI